MKKITALFLAALMALTLASCGKTEPTTDPDTPDISDNDVVVVVDGETDSVDEVNDESCVDIFVKIWSLYPEDDRFSAMGGDYENPVDGAPGSFSLADAESASYTLKVPADTLAMADECASLMHMMNANTFTGAVFHIADKANVQSFCDAAKDTVASEQWMCGFPDKHLVVVINDSYVLSAFGNIDILTTFRDKVNESGYSVSEAYWVDIE